MSSSLYHGFRISREALGQPLRVSIAEEYIVLDTKIFQDCVLENFSIGYPINLIPIAMGDVCVIVGMDWLS